MITPDVRKRIRKRLRVEIIVIFFGKGKEERERKDGKKEKKNRGNEEKGKYFEIPKKGIQVSLYTFPEKYEEKDEIYEYWVISTVVDLFHNCFKCETN